MACQDERRKREKIQCDFFWVQVPCNSNQYLKLQLFGRFENTGSRSHVIV